MEELIEILKNSELVSKAYYDESDLAVVLNGSYKSTDLSKFCFEKGFPLSKIVVKKQSLEDQFLKLVK